MGKIFYVLGGEQMADYNSSYTGLQIDTAIGKVIDKTVETSADKVSFTPGDSTLNSTNVQDALEELAEKPSGGSSRTHKIVIGVSSAGWTEDDCDYLCDGGNDKAIIQSAINTLSYTTGGVLYFLEGTYNFSQLMVSKNNVVFAGDNQKTVFWCAEPEKYLIYTSEDLIFKDITFHHVEGTKETLSVSGGRLQVLHCKFDVRSGLDIVSDTGVLLTDSEFNHVQIDNYAGHSVGARVYRCSRTENVSADSTPWLLIGGDDVVVDSCYIDSPHTAIQTTGYNVSITNNYITNCQYGIMTSGDVSSYNILNNVIVEYGSYGIYTSGMDNSYMNVSGNYVGMRDTTLYPSGTPIAIAGERNVITSNITPNKEITTMGSRVLIDNNSY